MRKLLLIFVGIIAFAGSKAQTADTLVPDVNSKFLVFPFFLQSPETSWGFGGAAAHFFKVKKDDVFSRTSDINLLALYTLREQIVVVLNSTAYFPEEKKIFRFQSSYSYYPDKFWGIGNNTPDSAKEQYSMKQIFITPQMLFKIRGRFYIGACLELQNVKDFKYVADGIFDNDSVVGRYGGYTGGGGILLTFDSRNNAYSPDKGSFAERLLFMFMAAYWLFTTIKGLQAIKLKNILSHKNWMIRSYSMAMTAVSFRVYHIIFYYYGVGHLHNYEISLWISVLGNMLLAEYFIFRKCNNYLKTFTQ